MNRKALWQLVRREAAMSYSALAMGIFMQCGFLAVALYSRLIPDMSVLAMSIIMGWIYAVIWSMSPIGSERHEGTLELLFLLPVRPWQILAVKMAVAAVGVMIPLAIAGLLFAVMTQGRELELMFVRQGYIGGMFGAVAFLFWSMCLGVRQPNETRVAMVGLGMFFGGWLILTLTAQILNLNGEAMAHIISYCPFGPLIAMAEIKREMKLTIMNQTYFCNSLIMLLLTAYAVWQFPKPNKTRG